MSNPLKPILAGLERKLAKFEHEAQARQRLVDQVRAALPDPEKRHVVSATYEDDTLVIRADSSVWSARLRYCEAALRAGLKAVDGKSFAKLRLRVGQTPDQDG